MCHWVSVTNYRYPYQFKCEQCRTLRVTAVMKVLMPRFIRSSPTSRHTISMNHVLEGRGGSLRGSFLIGAQTELPMGSRVECSGELASNWAAEFSHLTQRGSVCGPTLRVFCQHQL